MRPDSSSPHRHVSAGPQFHQMYALQPQSGCHLSLCVCERVFLCFLAQNPPFPGCSEHKETGSPLQQCTEDYRLHPCLPRAFFPSIQNLTPLCYPSLPPAGACGFSHYFLGVREKEDHVRNGPPLSPSLFRLSRTEKETRRSSVKQTERERKR